MTRDEFESILEEAYIEGYNSALEDIQEDILDEEAFDLEDDYEYYTEDSGHPRNITRQFSIGGDTVKGLRINKDSKKIRHKFNQLTRQGIDLQNLPENDSRLKNIKSIGDKVIKKLQHKDNIMHNAEKINKFQNNKLKSLKDRILINSKLNIFK